jgi:hypothetical protein
MSEKRAIPFDEAFENVQIMADRLALLYRHFVVRLEEKLGTEDAEKFVREVIEGYGRDCGKQIADDLVDQGLEPVWVNYSKSRGQPSVGWIGEEADEREKEGLIYCAKIRRCPLATAWKNLDFERWGRLYCHVDQVKFPEFDSRLVCTHRKNLMDGDDCCLICVEKAEI